MPDFRVWPETETPFRLPRNSLFLFAQGPPNIDAIVTLVQLGARLSSLGGHASLEPVLHIAARSGRADMVQALLRCGIDVQCRAKVRGGRVDEYIGPNGYQVHAGCDAPGSWTPCCIGEAAPYRRGCLPLSLMQPLHACWSAFRIDQDAQKPFMSAIIFSLTPPHSSFWRGSA